MSLSRGLRRAGTLPPVLAWHLAVLVSLPMTLPVAAVLCLPSRSTRPVRTVLLLAAYSGLELVALGRIAQVDIETRGRPDGDPAVAARWQELVHWVVDTGYTVIRRVLGVTVRLENGSASRDSVRACNGLIVLARHCGPGDTLLIAWLLVVHYGLRLRIVLKSLLRVVPAIDLAGDRLPFCFIGARKHAARDGIAELAGDLRTGEALLLFPEGGNFSSRRWSEAVRAVAHSGQRLRVRRLRHNEHTLPPRVGGVSAAVSAAPAASVLLLTHCGLGVDGNDRPWWQLPVRHEMVVRTLLVPAAQVPRDDGVSDWLDESWTQLDTWIDGHAALDAASGAVGA